MRCWNTPRPYAGAVTSHTAEFLRHPHYTDNRPAFQGRVYGNGPVSYLMRCREQTTLHRFYLSRREAQRGPGTFPPPAGGTVERKSHTATQEENTVKKALIITLFLVLICSLAACGEPDDRAENTSTDQASTSTTEPTATTPSQPEETGDTSEAEGTTSTPVEAEPASTEESAEPENTPEPADTTSPQPEGNSDASEAGGNTSGPEATSEPAPAPQQSGDTYEDDPDIPMEVNNPEYDLEALLPGLRTWDEYGAHYDWNELEEHALEEMQQNGSN